VVEDEGAVCRIIILKKMRCAETTLLYLLLSHSQKSLICQKETRYVEVWRKSTVSG